MYVVSIVITLSLLLRRTSLLCMLYIITTIRNLYSTYKKWLSRLTQKNSSLENCRSGSFPKTLSKEKSHLSSPFSVPFKLLHVFSKIRKESYALITKTKESKKGYQLDIRRFLSHSGFLTGRVTNYRQSFFKFMVLLLLGRKSGDRGYSKKFYLIKRLFITRSFYSNRPKLVGDTTGTPVFF